MSSPADSNERETADLTAEQLQFASELGVDLQAGVDARTIVLGIEQQLGQDSLLQLARWFLISVMRHLQQADWQSLDDCGLSQERQCELAAEFIARDEYKQSLLVVLKDYRFRFAILKFAKGRNPEQRILSSTTKAFRHARDILIQRGLVDAKPAKRRGRRPALKSSAEVNTIANRRAARRGPRLVPPETQLKENSSGNIAKPGLEMSEEEFVELDKALGGSNSQGGEPWTYSSNDERFSLLLGALAGGALFGAVLWLFF